MKRHGRHHSRNLSAHFFDATKISTAQDDDEAQVDKTTFMKREGIVGSSPAAGQKHRRMFSGDVSNPPMAHRRINSIGNAAAVDRYLQRPRGRHCREDSAGLDILSAAADVTNDELADAAGARTTPVWEGAPPTSAANGGAPTYHSRYNSLDFNDYGSAPGPAPPAPSSRPPSRAAGGAMKPPPARAFPHSHAVAPGGYGPPPPAGHHHPHHPHHPPPTVTYHHHGPYPPHSSYYAPPLPGHPAARTAGYPVQYSRHPPPPDMYKQQGPPPPAPPPHAMYAPPPPPRVQHAPVMAPPPPSPPTEESMARQPSPTAPFGDEKIESDERLFASTGTTTVPPGGTSNSDEGNDENANVNPAEPPRPSSRGAHHRKLSSFSSLNGLMGSSIFSPGGGDNSEHPLKSHHRNTSSTVSFLQGLDVLEGSDVMFLRNLHASTPHYGGGPPPLSSSAPPQPIAPESHGNPPPINAVHQQEMENHARQQRNVDSPEGPDGSRLASGGTSKRIRRKCTVANCPNRVVQGGLCISHGAKRKTCGHPGCTKNVKKAGMCSTHGPARRRCDADNCNKVAVQGGRCIAHGAKKKLCSVENCKKQAILTGMCKKHHDKLGGADPNNPMTCTVIGGDGKGPSHKSGHTRGLSIFQDLSADAVQNLLAGDDPLAL